MEMPAFHFWYEIEKIQRNQAKVLECANATAKAYAEEIGHPEGLLTVAKFVDLLYTLGIFFGASIFSQRMLNICKDS
jgi:hypothetical protein